MTIREDEQRLAWRRENSKLNAILGALVTIAVAGGGWVLRMESETAALRQMTEAQASRMDALVTRQDALEAGRDADREAVIRIGAQLEAQGRSIERIEASVSDLVRYLRGLDDNGRR